MKVWVVILIGVCLLVVIGLYINAYSVDKDSKRTTEGTKDVIKSAVNQFNAYNAAPKMKASLSGGQIKYCCGPGWTLMGSVCHREENGVQWNVRATPCADQSFSK